MSQFLGQKSHTILLVQEGKSKTYSTHGTFEAACAFLIQKYESKLKELNPQLKHIQYSVTDLHKYLDSLTDVTAMCCDSSTFQYQGVSKAKVKKGVLGYLTNKSKWFSTAVVEMSTTRILKYNRPVTGTSSPGVIYFTSLESAVYYPREESSRGEEEVRRRLTTEWSQGHQKNGHSRRALFWQRRILFALNSLLIVIPHFHKFYQWISFFRLPIESYSGLRPLVY